MLKHLPEIFLKKLQKTMLYSKKAVSYRGNIDRRTYGSNTAADITDYNLTDRIGKFAGVINAERICRVPLRYFCDIGRTISI